MWEFVFRFIREVSTTERKGILETWSLTRGDRKLRLDCQKTFLLKMCKKKKKDDEHILKYSLTSLFSNLNNHHIFIEI